MVAASVESSPNAARPDRGHLLGGVLTSRHERVEHRLREHPPAVGARGVGHDEVDEVALCVAHGTDAVRAALTAEAAEASPPGEGAAGAGGEPVEVALREPLPAERVVRAHQVPPSPGAPARRAPGPGSGRGSAGPPGSVRVVGLRPSTSSCTARVIGDAGAERRLAELGGASADLLVGARLGLKDRAGDRAPAVAGGVVTHGEGEQRSGQVDLDGDAAAEGAVP